MSAPYEVLRNVTTVVVLVPDVLNELQLGDHSRREMLGPCRFYDITVWAL